MPILVLIALAVIVVVVVITLAVSFGGGLPMAPGVQGAFGGLEYPTAEDAIVSDAPIFVLNPQTSLNAPSPMVVLGLGDRLATKGAIVGVRHAAIAPELEPTLMDMVGRKQATATVEGVRESDYTLAYQDDKARAQAASQLQSDTDLAEAGGWALLPDFSYGAPLVSIDVQILSPKVAPVQIETDDLASATPLIELVGYDALPDDALGWPLMTLDGKTWSVEAAYEEGLAVEADSRTPVSAEADAIVVIREATLTRTADGEGLIVTGEMAASGNCALLCSVMVVHDVPDAGGVGFIGEGVVSKHGVALQVAGLNALQPGVEQLAVLDNGSGMMVVLDNGSGMMREGIVYDAGDGVSLDDVKATAQPLMMLTYGDGDVAAIPSASLVSNTNRRTTGIVFDGDNNLERTTGIVFNDADEAGRTTGIVLYGGAEAGRTTGIVFNEADGSRSAAGIDLDEVEMLGRTTGIVFNAPVALNGSEMVGLAPDSMTTPAIDYLSTFEEMWIARTTMLTVSSLDLKALSARSAQSVAFDTEAQMLNAVQVAASAAR
ncbi:MAG: hypothetical protein AAFV53_12635 [Myxococcota bacterium]